MTKPVVLWADLTYNGGSSDTRKQIAQHCHVRRTRTDTSDSRPDQRATPDFGFLEYDYPDRRGLAILQDLKRRRPSLPLIMVTLSHCEELAVWAFRNGVWDYLTTPASDTEIERLHRRMCHLLAARSGNDRREPAIGQCSLPLSSQYTARPDARSGIAPALAYIQSHFAEKISEERLARLCGMSKFRFSRAFREQTGATFRESLLRYRLEKAAQLLENPALAITQVAFMAGFNDASHFGKMFRRQYGRTPTDFRASQPKGAAASHADLADAAPAGASQLAQVALFVPGRWSG